MCPQQVPICLPSWCSCLLLLCTPTTQVGEIATHHKVEVQELVREMLPLGQQYLRASCSSSDSSSAQQQLSEDAVTHQLLSYSLSIAAAVPSRAMARAEFGWRNGFLLGLPQGRTPKHLEWLATAGCEDLVG